jgi:ankyrin repeat protein
MSIILTHEYEGNYVCPICRELFQENDILILVQHATISTRKPEKVAMARRRKHLFHSDCFQMYMNTCDSPTEVLCPFDRETVTCLITLHYSDIIPLNLLHFTHNYYEIIDKLTQGNIRISIIDSVNLNRLDDQGKTLLYCACQRGHLKLVKRIVSLGGNPTIPDRQGFTPLMAATSHNYLTMVKYLLTLPVVKMTLNLADHQGKSAIEYAQDNGHHQCVKYLLKMGQFDPRILHSVLTRYQRNTFPTTSKVLIQDLRNLIRNHLKIDLNTPVSMTLRPQIIPSYGNKVNKMVNDRLEIETNTSLFNQIYRPREMESLNRSVYPNYTDKDADAVPLNQDHIPIYLDSIYQPHDHHDHHDLHKDVNG